MVELSTGQKNFLAEFLSNFSIAWIVGAVISPFFTGSLASSASWSKVILGLVNALWTFILGLAITKDVS